LDTAALVVSKLAKTNLHPSGLSPKAALKRGHQSPELRPRFQRRGLCFTVRSDFRAGQHDRYRPQVTKPLVAPLAAVAQERWTLDLSWISVVGRTATTDPQGQNHLGQNHLGQNHRRQNYPGAKRLSEVGDP